MAKVADNFNASEIDDLVVAVEDLEWLFKKRLP